MDDYPEPAPPKPATPVPRIDANARRDNARIAVQYAEERTSHVQWQRNGSAMQVESTDFPIQNVELMQSNSIQAAYTPVLTPTQCSEDLALRRSNVDGNFYSHEFDREEMVEVTDEERSQTSSFEEQWKTRVFETQPRRVRPDPFQISNGSLLEHTLPSLRVQELAEPVQISPHHSSNGSLRERALPSARVQELVAPPSHETVRIGNARHLAYVSRKQLNHPNPWTNSGNWLSN